MITTKFNISALQSQIMHDSFFIDAHHNFAISCVNLHVTRGPGLYSILNYNYNYNSILRKLL